MRLHVPVPKLWLQLRRSEDNTPIRQMKKQTFSHSGSPILYNNLEFSICVYNLKQGMSMRAAMHNIPLSLEPLYLQNLHNNSQIEILYFKLTVCFEAKEWIIRKIVIVMWLILETIWLMEVRMSKEKKKKKVSSCSPVCSLCPCSVFIPLEMRCHCSWLQGLFEGDRPA